MRSHLQGEENSNASQYSDESGSEFISETVRQRVGYSTEQRHFCRICFLYSGSFRWGQINKGRNIRNLSEKEVEISRKSSFGHFVSLCLSILDPSSAECAF